MVVILVNTYGHIQQDGMSDYNSQRQPSLYEVMNNIVVISVILEILSSLKMESYVHPLVVPLTYKVLFPVLQVILCRYI